MSFPRKIVPVAEADQNLAFLDGYLFREMVRILTSDGSESSGLYSYYRARIEQERSTLAGYDRILFKYLLMNFDRERRQIVHAGIGLGILALVLAQAGFTVAGVELDDKRFMSASRLRDALAEVWPDAANCYTLLHGEFPGKVANTSWIASESILLFTNVGAGWTEEATKHIISLFPRFGDVILDTRLFGIIRDTPEERDALIHQIEDQGLVVTPIPETTALNAFYHHMRPRVPIQ